MRIGKCLSFGCNPQQTADAVALVRAVVDHYANIMMTLAGCATRADLVPKQTLRAGGETSDETSGEGSELPWMTFGRTDRMLQVAVCAVTRVLDHTVATASLQYEWLWRLLQDGDSALFPSRLIVTGVHLNDRCTRKERSETISAHAQLRAYDVLEDRANLIWRVLIWSNVEMTVTADVTIYTSTFFNEATPQARRLLEQELTRMAAFGYDEPTRIQKRNLLAALILRINKLEKGTHKSKHAVEDLGSATPF
ncbi:hypothetical protein LZ30DRAFT_780404 [Colletotrichum cereale]|nr:hypothetical protein LZ30DRAFT_780404 [Colletotrichum cereale]